MSYDLDLRALQLAIESEYSIEHTREVLTEAVTYFANLENNRNNVKIILKDLRDFDCDTLEEKEIFFINPETYNPSFIPKEYKSYSLGIFNGEACSYYGRLVYPVRDVKGKVMGLCGWEPNEQPKYLDSKTYGYSKQSCMYGMEKMYDYYSNNKPVFIVEGIPCCNYLRSKGFNSLALLGSNLTKYNIEILKRFGNRCILIPDNDKAGLNVYNVAKYKLPKSRCFVSLVSKDIDDTRKVENHKYEDTLLNELSTIENPFIPRKILRILK